VLQGARSAGQYEGSLREIIHAFKYEGRRVLAAPLGAMVRAAGVDFLREADGVVPVPLYPWRAFRRGFNQADDLARHLGLPVVTALRRRSGGPPQASLPAAQRHANVPGCVRAAPFADDGRRSRATPGRRPRARTDR
jgi:predicted amidophosphoribosyltransferase